MGADQGQDGGRDHGAERRVRSQHQDPGRTEEGIADEAEDRRVQASDRRQPGQLRVGHPLRDQQGGEDQARGEVSGEPPHLVTPEHRHPGHPPRHPGDGGRVPISGRH